MEIIGDTLARDLNKKIDEIIQVDQVDDQSISGEIEEYIVTDRIKSQYEEILSELADYRSDPHKKIGIWLSGFFGSGKSSFAKNLGYMLGDISIGDRKVFELFKEKFEDQKISNLLDYIHQAVPCEVIMFDVSKAREVASGDEKISEVLYRSLLSHLGYAQDYIIAELEIELEGELEGKKLEDFIRLSREVTGKEWEKARIGAKKLNYASAILHKMDPVTFSQPDSWLLGVQGKRITLTVHDVVKRIFDLFLRRVPGKIPFIVIDEVGQYVARSNDKLEDLKALVEELGRVGMNQVKGNGAVGPAWLVVTSQERLEEVVADIDSKRILLTKLLDRFVPVDLAPSDIKEVATRRVLGKKKDAELLILKLYRENQGQLNQATRMERTFYYREIDEAGFLQCYPYLPHFIDISIDIMSGLRSQSGALRHYGGSNRTIIKQAYELLVNERTALASKSIGTLVTLDRIFDLVEGNLSSEKSKDINNIIIRFKDGWPARVVKVVCLLEFLKELPRTDVNIAACLVDEVGRPSPLPEVREAIMLLEKENALHATQAGWSLPTRDFINWKRKKDGIKAPVPEKKKIVRDAISKIFADQGISKYRYRNIKSFDLSVSLDEMERGPAPSGGLRLRLFSEDEISDRDEMKRRLQEASWAGKDDFHFLIYLDSMIDDLAAGIYRSERMVSEYNQLKAQSKINSEEIALLEEEKKEKARLEGLLGQKITQAIGEGTSIFRGVVRDASDLGEGPDAIFRALFEEGVPALYPMLTHFNIPLKGGEAEMLLKAANLNGLTSAFYREDPEEALLVKEGSSYKPNDRAVLLRSLMDYLKERKSYSDNEALQGRALEEHFKGIGFGADPEVVRLGLALLFRAGRIEVSSAGQRFDSYQEPKSREAFTNVKTFRAAHFHPLEIPATPTLVRALKACENLTGERIEAVEMVAISSAARSFADKTIARLLPVEAIVAANGLPGKEQLAELKGLLEKMKKCGSTDSVHLLANEGERIRGLVDLLNRIRQHSDGHSVDLVRRARVAAGEMAAVLEARGQKDIAEARGALQELLASEDIYSNHEALRACSEEIERSYHALYSDLHLRRGEAFSAALRELEGSESWAKAGEPGRTQAIRELSLRACQQTPAAKALACSKCGAAVGQMDSDLAALGSFTEAAKSELARLAKPIAGPTITTTATTAVDAVERKTQKVALKSFFTEPMDSEEAVNQAVAKLREHLLELVRKKVRLMVE